MIFISYRIDDSNDVVSRLATDLMEEFGDDAVFLDTLRLKGSQNWPEEIDRQVRDCQVMLVAIGRIWQEVRFESGKFKGFPRLHDEQDWVRREITLGLKQSKILIPVLINGALPPDEEWLETVGLKGLHSKQAMTLRTKDYPNDFQDLIAVMRKDCPLLPQGTEKKRLKSSDPADVALIPRPSSITYYLNRLTEETASLALLGMGRGLQIDLPISEAYVPLRTMLARSMGLRGTETFQSGRAEHEEDVELGSVFHKAAHLGLRAVILLGEPGSGKTTGARQMAWRLASGKNSPSELGLPAGMIPVLLRFRNLSRAALENKNDGLRLFLEEETRCALAPEGQQAPAKDLLSHNAGGLLWILDGLDEVIDPKARSTVAGWIRKGLKQRPSDWFLVTCRFQGYFRDGVPLGPQFVEFHVRPLDDGQVEQFVRDWFSAAFKKLLGPGPTSEARAADDSTRLLEILALPAYQTGRIRELRTNPLLLTILCIVFHEERKLPTGRAELYAHCIRVFLETWRRELYESAQGDKVEPYDARAAQDVLAQVAWWMHQQQDRTAAPLEDLAAEAATGLMDVADNSGLGRDGGRFLERMRDETGILALGGDGRCGFLHLSFQEYLAAEHAVGRGLAKELATRAPQSWWREVALLSLRSSQPYCEKFFVELLAAGIADDHPELADRCLNEARYVTLAPFLEALQQGGSTTRVAAVLRLLRDRVAQAPPDQFSLIETFCRRLINSPKDNDLQTRGFAAEILMRLGIQTPQTRGPALIVEEKSGMTFVRVPKGEFLMGSERGDADEKLVHKVLISQPFVLGKYQVTNAQYARFLESADGNTRKPAYWDDRRFNQPEQPVVGVSWNEAMAFAKWAGGRLPTEAEWEYACRAGTTTEYSFGDDEGGLSQYSWFDENSGDQTQPVGSKKPNAWDLYDMHGNVWEWCLDWWGVYSADVVDDPRGPEKGQYRVNRGGSWFADASDCRSAVRNGSRPNYRDYYLGFRVVLSSVR